MQAHKPLFSLALAALLLSTTTGCPEKTFEVAPVSGTVTLDGKPLEGARVKFQPLATSRDGEVGGGSFGNTDADGKYTLQLILQDGEGAVVGKHKVYISSGSPDSEADNPKIVGEKVPREWREGVHEFEVPAEGTTSADFAITTR